MNDAILHYPSGTESPVGIWWADSKGLKSHYLQPDSPEETYARQVMTQKLDDAEWSDFFNSLEDTTPLVAGWERLTVTGEKGARVALASLNTPEMAAA